MIELLKQYIKESFYDIGEMCECEWWSLDKINVSVKQRLRDSFPFKGPLTEEQLIKRIESGSLFGYVMCDFHVPEHLK